jgi:hypothetical protein
MRIELQGLFVPHNSAGLRDQSVAETPTRFVSNAN